jgi:hypothetical protein
MSSKFSLSGEPARKLKRTENMAKILRKTQLGQQIKVQCNNSLNIHSHDIRFNVLGSSEHRHKFK